MRKISINTIVCVMLAFTIFSGIFFVGSENFIENYASADQNDYRNSELTRINISEYSEESVDKITYTKNILSQSGLDNNILEKMSDEVLYNFADSDSLVIQKSNWSSEIVDESAITYGGGDFFIYTILLDKGRSVEQNGITYKVYEAIVLANWYKAPIYRLTDILGLTASNAIYGPTSERYGEAYLSYYDKSTDSLVDEEYKLYDYRDDNILTEYGYGFSMNIDLPLDFINKNNCKYKSMTFILGTTLYAKEPFTLYSAYGHKYFGGKAKIKARTGAKIDFDIATYKYYGRMLSSVAF